MSADEFEAFDTTSWFNWQQPALPYYLDPCFEACASEFRRIFGFPFFTSILYYRKPNSTTTEGSWLLRYDEGVAVGRWLTDLLLVPTFAASTLAAVDSLYGDAIGPPGVSSAEDASVAEICSLVADAGRAYTRFYAVGSITEPVSWYAEGHLRKELNSAGVTDVSEALGLLLTPSEPSFLLAIEKDLIAIRDALQVPAGFGDDASRLIAEHLQSFSWRRNSYGQCSSMSYEDVVEEASSLPDDADERLETARNVRDEAMAAREALLPSLTPRGRRIVDVADRFGAGLADRRKAMVLRILQRLDGLLRLVSEQADIPLADLTFLSPSEFDLVRDRRPLAMDISAARRDAYVLTLSPSPMDDQSMARELDLMEPAWETRGSAAPQQTTAERYASEDAIEQLRAIDFTYGLFTSDVSQILQGTVASRGRPPIERLRGVCRVVTNARDAHIDAGQILVASSTTPDFIHLMRKCGAILTQQGGLASHASLTARELGVPCIVGIAGLLSRVQNEQSLVVNFVSGLVETADE